MRYTLVMVNALTTQTVSTIPAAAWNDLNIDQHPFLSHSFLSGLEQHGCLRQRLGWQPSPVTIMADKQLVAAAPAYIKTNSHGEFVFDHAWAHAYGRFGRNYFPKLLIAAPYTPVTGPRLMAQHSALRLQLIEAIETQVENMQLSSAHINFLPENELSAFPEHWLSRQDVQFHWQNTQGWQSFDDFLAALIRKKRKNILQERQQVGKAGVSMRCVSGKNASEDDIANMHMFYCSTQLEKGNHPVMTLEFFRHLVMQMPEQVVMFFADQNDETVAGAFCMRNASTLYGRYWGASKNIAGLHFETCYYQGIDYCLREGLTRFEPGAQGEHKIARGFLPVFTYSKHFIADEAFAAALRPWCEQDIAHVARYRDDALTHSPYRHDD
jgi:uncharacterized protein